MLDIDVASEGGRTSQSYEAPPPRDRLPTLPEDLSEYAWLHTGPPSWTEDHPERDELADSFGEQGPLDEMTAGLLVDLWHSDVPHVMSAITTVVDEHEARILSLMDGQTTIGALLETSGLPLPDLLGNLCELCARGVVKLDRSRRLAGE
jgi:hypothetical protein